MIKYITIPAILVFLGCQYEQQQMIRPRPEHPRVTEEKLPQNKAVTKTTNIHFNSKYCTECHEKTPTAKKIGPLKFNGDFKQLCRCHVDSPEGYIHPVGIEPSKDKILKIPEGMPLQQGKLSCITCHDMLIQCKLDSPDYLMKKGQNLLRGAPYMRRTDFCYNCHDKNLYKKYYPHKQLGEKQDIIVKTCLYCHTEKPDEETATYKEVKLIGDLETLCVRCHVQELADRRSLHGSHLRKPSEKVLARIHQMETEYGIVLPLDPEGKITCATCHNPHEKGVIPEKRPGAKGAGEVHRQRLPDKICLKCHQM